MQRLFFGLIAGLVVGVIVNAKGVDADVFRSGGGYVTFCCQAGPHAGEPGVTAVFGPCFESSDNKGARECRREPVYFYPMAVRTDGAFAFNNETGELRLLDH